MSHAASILHLETMARLEPAYTRSMPFDRARFQYLREQSVLTQAELASRDGISELSVHKIETGQQEPRPATIRKLARALKIKPAELIAEPQS